MNLSHGNFYKTNKEAKTAIKQYFKVHYVIRLIRPRQINKFLFIGDRPRRITKNFIRRESASDE